MCCRCVWDIFNLGVSRRKFADCCALLGAVRQYIADGSWRRNVPNFNACIGFLMPRCLGEAWRLRGERSFAELLEGGGDAQMCVHRESIGTGLKKHVGPLH